MINLIKGVDSLTPTFRLKVITFTTIKIMPDVGDEKAETVFKINNADRHAAAYHLIWHGWFYDY